MENYISRFILICFLLTTCNSAYLSQTEKSILKGKVVNKETSEPIQYATVFLAYTSKGSLTDEKGEFIITGIA
ncbi:MAG: carboxypeptidase-like regulatory domain-containing protein, partial [Melioribacteraceae bacterium]